MCASDDLALGVDHTVRVLIHCAATTCGVHIRLAPPTTTATHTDSAIAVRHPPQRHNATTPQQPTHTRNPSTRHTCTAASDMQLASNCLQNVTKAPLSNTVAAPSKVRATATNPFLFRLFASPRCVNVSRTALASMRRFLDTCVCGVWSVWCQ